MEHTSSPWIRFDPQRRKGYALNSVVLLIDFVILFFLLVNAINQPPGLVVILALLAALLVSFPLPIFLYRLYSLWQSGYWLGRDGLRLRWGLRLVDLPYDKILDVARIDELEQALTPPRWTWPGGVVGEITDSELGLVEFLAAEKENLVVIGTKDRVFAISPENAREFVSSYRRESERGSLRPLTAHSVQPIFVLMDAWTEPKTRRLLIAGGMFALGLLILVGILAPTLETVTLGFGVDGQPLPGVAGVQLFLLPALNLFFYMGNFILGLLFYREPRGVFISHLVWGSSLATSIFFLGALLQPVVYPHECPSFPQPPESYPQPMIEAVIQFSSTNLLLGVGLAAAIAGIAWRLKMLSADGWLAATLLGGTTFGVGGLPAAILLIVFFASSSLFSKAFARRKNKVTANFAKGGRRDSAQVVANGGIAMVGLVVAAIGWVPEPIAWVVFSASLATVTADTWATEVGLLSSRQPFLITTGKRVPRGSSGGVSLLGSFIAFTASLCIAFLAWFLGITAIAIVPLVAIAGLLGSFLDSLLGATVQAIYYCPKCEKETERNPTHYCGTPTTLYRGLRWLDNDWVNFLSSAFGALLAVGLFAIFM